MLVSSVLLATLIAFTGIEPAAPVAGRGREIENHLAALAALTTNTRRSMALDLKRLLSSDGPEEGAIAGSPNGILAALGRPFVLDRQALQALGSGQGSDPFAAEDFLSRLTGSTQSETTAAWCGRNALIGFNDSGSFAATTFGAVSPSGSLSFNGWSRSTDAGASYTDMGPLLADPIPAGLKTRDLFGDPVLGCTSRSNFYYASLATDTAIDGSTFTSGISVSRSTNGGASFPRTVLAAGKDAQAHFLDKPWMAVQPGPTGSPNDDRLHVTYTDFDASGTSAACPGQTRTAIEYVRSIDGGATWSAHRVIDVVCGDESFVQGSHVAAGVGNDVYVAWERFTDFQTRDIRIRRSTDGGASFGPARLVDQVTPIGDGFVLQGVFRVFLDLQGLVVDRTTGPHRGSVYLTWHDGRYRSRPDPLAGCGGTPTYCFGDVVLSRSTNGGAGWSAPIRINDDPITLGIDQWFPAIDVDRTGTIWVAFYDRRRDPRNFLIDTFVASSTNGGHTWDNVRATRHNFPAITGWQDAVVNPLYMGDYIAVAADSLGAHDGVVVAWGDNSLGDANVLQRRFRA